MIYNVWLFPVVLNLVINICGKVLTDSAHDVTYLLQLFRNLTCARLEITAALKRHCSKSAAALSLTLNRMPGNVFCCCEEIMNTIIFPPFG